MQALVTISIPIFKCEDFLVRCLESVRAQTYQNLEVTLINDQTPDNSVEIAEKYIEKYQLHNWKIYHLEQNSGLSIVRNKGIETAQGKYIFFLDNDDEITPQCIQEMADFSEKENLQMVVGNVQTIDAETLMEKNIFNISTKEDILKDNSKILEAFVNGDYPTSSWNKLIRTDFLKKEKLYFTRGLFAQDALQSFQTALKLNSIGFLKHKTYRYYLHKNSVIHNRKKIHFQNWMTIAKEIDAALKLEKENFRKNLILRHLIDFKTTTLLMNWKAQKNETLWKESYANYKNLSALSFADYFSNNFDSKTKKADLFNRLPTNFGFKFFKWRYER